jgi:hypothetical protein
MRSVSGSTLRINVPVLKKWNLFRFHSLPFGNSSNGIFLVASGSGKLLGIDRKGNTFDYDPLACTIRKGINVCDGTKLRIASKPSSCISKLLKLKHRGIASEFPTECKKFFQLIVKPDQQFLQREDDLLIFTPYADTISVKFSNGTLFTIGNLSVGINKVVGAGTFYTDQLIIFRFQSQAADQLEPVILSELSDKFLQLTEMLSYIPRINDSDLINHMHEFMASESKEGIDLGKAEIQLQHAHKLGMLENFSVSHFTLNTITRVNGIVSWISMCIVALICLLPVIACCGACKCCRACTGSLFKGLWFIIKNIILLLWQPVLYLCSYAASSEQTGEAGGLVDDAASDKKGLGTIDSHGETFFLEKRSSGIKWYVVRSCEERVLIQATCDGRIIWYCPLRKEVYNETGTVPAVPVPGQAVLKQYERELRTLLIPEYFMKDDKRLLTNFPTIFYDPAVKKYMSVDSGIVCSGFRIPVT